MRLLVVSHACVTDINQQIYLEMEKMGHHVDIIVPSNFVATGLANKPIKVKRWPGFNGRIIEIPTIFNKSIPLHFYKKSLKKVFADSNPDAIYVAEEPYSISCYQVLKSALSHTTAVGFYSAQNIQKEYPFLFKKMEKYVYKNAALAVSISADVTSVLRNKGYKNNICEIPLGVDEQHFQISQKWRKEARKDAGIPENAFVIGFAGRLVQEKGIDLLIKAFQYNTKKIQNIHLLIVGRGPLISTMKEKVMDYGLKEKVTFKVDAIHSEMPKWFNCMDVHVLPSKTMTNWREQFGRVLIEAAACGVPSIGSSSGEIPFVLEKLGMKAVFPEGNIEELAKELELAYQSISHPENIRDIAISQFGNRRIANKLIHAFQSVV
ncbi:glycosyltransferase [Niallia sp. Sow4_A1]|uniref:glycosyltransferase n=1 Tax=Niallia sp. Sow4_A1 TaxID=3438793 RepID=UPI003F9CBF1A